MGLSHGAQAAHAAVHLKAAALVNFHISGAFLHTGKQAAQHNRAGARGNGLGNIAAVLDAAVGNDGYAVLVGFLGTVADSRQLGHADTGHHTGGANAAGADAYLDAACARLNQVVGGGRGGYVARNQRNIRIGGANFPHLIQHSLAVAMGRVNAQHVHLGLYQGFHTQHAVRRNANGRAAQQAAVLVLGGIGIFAALFNILNGNQAAQLILVVHNGQLFNAVGGQQLLGLLQRGAHRRGNQVFAGHNLLDASRRIRFKPQIAVGQDAHQLFAQGNGHAADAVFGHQLFRFANGVRGGKEERIGDNAVLAALDLVHLNGLFLNGHVFVDDSQTAFTGNGNGHARVGYRIHGGAKHGNIQRNARHQLGRRIHVPGQHAACSGHQQYVVKSKSRSNVFL